MTQPRCMYVQYSRARYPWTRRASVAVCKGAFVPNRAQSSVAQCAQVGFTRSPWMLQHWARTRSFAGSGIRGTGRLPPPRRNSGQRPGNPSERRNRSQVDKRPVPARVDPPRHSLIRAGLTPRSPSPNRSAPGPPPCSAEFGGTSAPHGHLQTGGTYRNQAPPEARETTAARRTQKQLGLLHVPEPRSGMRLGE